MVSYDSHYQCQRSLKQRTANVYIGERLCVQIFYFLQRKKERERERERVREHVHACVYVSLDFELNERYAETIGNTLT